MGNPYRHPISTPVPELQGIATIASKPGAGLAWRLERIRDDNPQLTASDRGFLTEAAAALAASRPTDAGAGEIIENLRHVAERDQSPGDFRRNLFRAAADQIEQFAALATPKPPVDEAMRSVIIDLMAEWPDAHMPSRDLCLRAAAVIGSNLTGDGAGA